MTAVKILEEITKKTLNHKTINSPLQMTEHTPVRVIPSQLAESKLLIHPEDNKHFHMGKKRHYAH